MNKVLFVTVLSFLSIFLFGQTYTPGNVYYDSTGYVEYRAGNIPIIISASHGGTLEPVGIPDLSCNGTPSGFIDSYTKEIAEGIYNTFFDETGCYPHLIINHVHKKKFQPNANITNAACGNPTIEQAWYGYHGFIDSAKVQVEQDYGRGLLIDLHGHSHSIQRIELGYLLDTTELRLSDAMLNTSTYIEESSIRALVPANLQSHSHAELLRGQHSFGTLLENKGYPSIPSTSNPFTLIGEPYFTGGYITRRHGSRDNNGNIDAIQMEFNQYIRFNTLRRDTLIDSLSATLVEYIDYHYNNQFANNSCSVLPIELLNFNAELYPEYQYVRLVWSTLTEVNNDYFIIEKSLNGLEWEELGRVNGDGNSNEINNYSFIDNKLTNEKIYYYRLKQVDFDGTTNYTIIRSVSIYNNLNSRTEIYPNPIRLGQKITFSNQDEISSVTLFSLTGIEVNADNLLDRKIPTVISSGVYLLKIELKSGNMEFIKMFIK